ncbi:MAG: hypothetical protein ACYDCO_10160 [Armatimonadota bacterium]
MKKVPFRYEYHDALIRSFEVKDGQDLVLEIDLCGHYSGLHGGGMVHLFFYEVRNIDEVKEHLTSTSSELGNRKYIDEILGLDKNDKQGYTLYLASSGSLRIDAKRVSET